MGSAQAALPRKIESRSHRLEPRKEIKDQHEKDQGAVVGAKF